MKAYMDCSAVDLSVETLDFKFLLKPKDAETPCIIEEGPTRLLTGGMLEGDVRVALFKLNGDDEVLEFRVFNKADLVSPLELAASWRVYKENFQPSKVRGIPDISINVAPTNATEVIAFVLDTVCFPVVDAYGCKVPCLLCATCVTALSISYSLKQYN